jgi:hypothetical protein
MTLVSIKYTPSLTRRLHTLKVGIAADIRHRGQHFGQRAPTRPRQGDAQDVTMLSLGAATVRHSLRLQSANQLLVNATYQ